DLVQRVKAISLEAQEDQDFPFNVLVERLHPERDPSRPPIFQALLVLQKTGLSKELGIDALALNEPGAPIKMLGMEMESVALERKGAQFDLSVMVSEVAGEIIGCWQYNTDLFLAPTMSRMIDHFRTLLSAAISKPDVKICDLHVLTESERK